MLFSQMHERRTRHCWDLGSPQNPVRCRLQVSNTHEFRHLSSSGVEFRGDLLLKGGEITRRDAVKYLAVRRWLFFEKTLFDKLRDGLCNFRRPFSDAGVEHPPMKDAVDRVLCLRMPGEIIQNFWRRRWK